MTGKRSNNRSRGNSTILPFPFPLSTTIVLVFFCCCCLWWRSSLPSFVLFVEATTNSTSTNGTVKGGPGESTGGGTTLPPANETTTKIPPANNVDFWWDNLSSPRRQAALTQLGKIAFYARMYRTWIKSPMTGQTGFLREFPDLGGGGKLHRWLASNCTFLPGSTNIAGIENCIESVYENIQTRMQPIFLTIDYSPQEDFQIGEKEFKRVGANNALYNYDVSVSVMFCQWAMKRVRMLARLPYCIYGPEKHHKHHWPAEVFRDRDWVVDESRNNTDVFYSRIDHLDGTDFECAQESFCPDPCCGRLSGRFLTGSWGAPSQPCDTETRGGDYHGFACITKDLTGHWRDADRPILTNETKAYWKPSKTTCELKPEENDDLKAMLQNRWNVSCACLHDDGSLDASKKYNGAMWWCQDVDECVEYGAGKERLCPGPNEVCENRVGGFECVCPFGYVRQSPENRCARNNRTLPLPADIFAAIKAAENQNEAIDIGEY